MVGVVHRMTDPVLEEVLYSFTPISSKNKEKLTKFLNIFGLVILLNIMVEPSNMILTGLPKIGKLQAVIFGKKSEVMTFSGTECLIDNAWFGVHSLPQNRVMMLPPQFITKLHLPLMQPLMLIGLVNTSMKLQTENKMLLLLVLLLKCT